MQIDNKSNNSSNSSEITVKTSSKDYQQIPTAPNTERRADNSQMTHYFGISNIVHHVLSFCDREVLTWRMLSKDCYRICEELGGLLLMRDRFQIPFPSKNLIPLQPQTRIELVKKNIPCFLNEFFDPQIRNNREKLEFARKHTGINLKINSNEELSEFARLIKEKSDVLSKFNGHKITGLDFSSIDVDDPTILDIITILAFINNNADTFQPSSLALNYIHSFNVNLHRLILDFFANREHTCPLTRLKIQYLETNINLCHFSNLEALKFKGIDKDAEEIILPNLNRLKKLALGQVDVLNKKRIKSILTKISNPSALVELTFGNFCHGDLNLNLNLERFTNVKYLKFGEFKLKCDISFKCPHLKKLKLGELKLSNIEKVKELLNIVTNSNISELIIDSVRRNLDFSAFNKLNNLENWSNLKNLKIKELNAEINLEPLINLEKLEIVVLEPRFLKGSEKLENLKDVRLHNLYAGIPGTILDTSQFVAMEKFDFGGSASFGGTLDLSKVSSSKLKRLIWTELKKGAKLDVILPSWRDTLTMIGDNRISLVTDIMKLRLLLIKNLISEYAQNLKSEINIWNLILFSVIYFFISLIC